MKNVAILGFVIMVAGILGIIFVTVPAITGVGDGIGNAVEGNNVGENISNAIVSGIVLYVSTGLFIVLIVFGGFVIFTNFEYGLEEVDI